MLRHRFRQHIRSQKVRIFFSAVAAFMGYGAWAFYVNHAYSLAISLKAAITQGSYSFVITLTMSWLMELLHQAFDTTRTRLPLTILITCLLLYTTSWGINALLGTPEIFMTILPGAVIGTLYTFSYGLALEKLSSKASAINSHRY
ncbi:MAG: hypothetical protein K9K86_03270 [Pseudomonadales bacterium]|nr:hypothetical protein [Pseudomonadales bacterium]